MENYKYMSLACILVILAYALTIYNQNTDYVYPEIGYTIKEFVESLGYAFENHSVVTSDGYILELHRILSSNQKPGMLPIFLMHGLLASSISWVTIGKISLPMYLASKGYDVWLGNARGNAYSRKHLTINPDSNPAEFFDFSWHEIGSVDVPAMIDYILEQTQHKKLYYAGHSQGSVAFFVMMSEKPEYNKKVEIMLGIAPVVYTKDIRSWAFTIPAQIQGFSEWLESVAGFYEFLPRTDVWTNFANVYCRDGALMQSLCNIPIGLTAGFNTLGSNSTLLPLLYSHAPAGAATRQLLHYTQVLNSDIFQQYDHGSEENIKRYGQMTPPLYDLSKTTVPVAIFWSDNDWITSERNIKQLQSALPNVVHEYKIPDEHFNHFDFILSFTAERLFYPELLNVIERHHDKN